MKFKIISLIKVSIYGLWFVLKRFLLIDTRKKIVNFPYSSHSSHIFFAGPLDGSKKDEGHFIRYYQERAFGYYKKNFSDIINIDKLYFPKVECVKGKIVSKKFSFLTKRDCVIPISNLNKDNVFNININGKQNVIKTPLRRFFYFRFNKNQEVKIINKKKFFLGEKIILKDKNVKKNKLVLAIFIDGLADLNTLIGKNYIRKYLPNTYKFFSKGTFFQNHFSNSDWSLPSFANIFTGRYIHHHGLFHPLKKHQIKSSVKILSEYFKKNGYLTSSIGGNWRANPFYGYNRGFDRLIYQKNINSHEIISNFFDHFRAFKNRRHFSLLSFADLHHFVDEIPEISIQTSMFPNYLKEEILNEKKNVKSVKRKFNEEQVVVYLESIKRLDDNLKVIYEFLNNNFKDNEYLVTIFTDHGQSFLNKNKNDEGTLSLARRKIVWFIRGQGIPQGISNELTDNFDIFDTLIKKSKLKYSKLNSEGRLPISLGGVKKKNFTFAQSIFPNTKYRSVMSDGNFELKSASKKNIEEIKMPNKKIEFEQKFVTKIKKIEKNKKKDLLKYSKKVFLNATKDLIIKNDL